MSALPFPPRPWSWALDPEPTGGGEAVLLDADGEVFMRAAVETDADIALLEFIIGAVNDDIRFRAAAPALQASGNGGEPDSGFDDAHYPAMTIREPDPLRYIPLSAVEAEEQKGDA